MNERAWNRWFNVTLIELSINELKHANQHGISFVRALMGWRKAKQMLIAYLTATATTIEPSKKLLCYFMLGKMFEKQNPSQIKQSLENYLWAERQLFDHQNDDAFLLIKLEINFRITASIYKYVTRPVNDAIDKTVLSSLLDVMTRNKNRIFTTTELAQRTSSVENIDENANRMDMEQENLVSAALFFGHSC